MNEVSKTLLVSKMRTTSPVFNLPGLCKFMGPFTWFKTHKSQGINQRESESMD